MTPEEIQKQKDELLAEVKQASTDSANEAVKSQLTDIEQKIEKAVTAEQLEEIKKSLSDEVASLQAKFKELKNTNMTTEKSVSVFDAISGAISENAEALKSFKGEKSIALKAVDNASWAAGALARQTTDVRRDLYLSPYSPLYLRNIFPNVSTDSSSIVIPQVQEITGAVASWARGTGELGVDEEKPEVSPKYKDVQVDVKWLAGFTTVNRELLMNVNYLQGSIANTLLYSRNGLFAAENALITAYLAANAPAYAGTATIPLEMIIDAAFNTLLGNYMNPTHVLMNQADYLEHIKFNKAVGSGEYDLPNDMLRGFAGSGLETSVQIVPVPSLTAGTAYVIAANEFEFINRLSPELAVAEQHDKNFTFNKVTFRVEEMVGFIAKDLNAMVKVTL